MIDYLKSNWKTVLVGAITAGLILWGLWGCESKPAEEALVAEPAVEEIKEAVEEATPEVEEAPVESIPEEIVE